MDAAARQPRDRAHVAAHMDMLQHAGAIRDALLAGLVLLPPRVAALAETAAADLTDDLRRQWRVIDLAPLLVIAR